MAGALGLQAVSVLRLKVALAFFLCLVFVVLGVRVAAPFLGLLKVLLGVVSKVLLGLVVSWVPVYSTGVPFLRFLAFRVVGRYLLV